MATLHIDNLLDAAVRLNASDLLLVADAVPMVRVARQEHPLDAPAMNAEALEDLLESLAPKTNRKQLKKRGRTAFAFSYHGRARVRAFACRHVGGLALSLRLLPPVPPRLENLGLPPIVKALARRPRGLFLVAGPACSGRTTTLAAVLDHLNRDVGNRLVATIENPIEYVHVPQKAAVMQREIGTHAETFTDAIDEARPQAADVVYISDLNDPDTIHAAVECARMDRLVFAAIFAGSVVEALTQLAAANGRLSPEHWRSRVASSVLAVLAQVLCPRVGGGMTLAYEFLIATPEAATLIAEDRPQHVSDLISAGKRFGMQLLDDHLLRLAHDGLIAEDDAVAASHDPAALRRRLKSEPDHAPQPAPQVAPRAYVPPDLRVQRM